MINIGQYNIGGGQQTKYKSKAYHDKQACARAPLHEKLHLNQIYSVQNMVQKVQTTVKLKTKIVNTTFVLKFTTPCKLVCKCDIYHLFSSSSFALFSPHLHGANLCQSNFSQKKKKTRLQDKRE